MIQRIQSLYFLLAALSSLVLSFFVSLYAGNQGPIMLIDEPIFMGLYILAGLSSLAALLYFKNRRTQVVFGRLAIIFNFILLGLMLYFWFDHYEATAKALGLGVFLPIIQVILLILANRAVMKDEAIVRAADRFR